MRANLSLVLDEKAQIRCDLLLNQELEEIDKYTTSKNNTNDIRDDYRDKIDNYLELNKKYISSFKRDANKKGSIVITYNDNQNQIKRMRVLYSKDIKKINSDEQLKRINNALLEIDDPIKTMELINKYLKLIFDCDYNNRILYYANKDIGYATINYQENNQKLLSKVNKKLVKMINDTILPLLNNEKQERQSLAYYYIRLIDSYIEKNFKVKTTREVIKTSKGKIEIAKQNLAKNNNTIVVKKTPYNGFEFKLEEYGQMSFIDEIPKDYYKYGYSDSYKDDFYDREDVKYEKR